MGDSTPWEYWAYVDTTITNIAFDIMTAIATRRHRATWNSEYL